MAGAAELPRPGVEVVQEFASVSPTIVLPTLVPCNVAPFFEVIEALNTDGTVNDDSKLTDLYEQLELTIGQSSFPSPRGNIDEVDVLEDSIRGFFEFGGELIELSQTQAFLTAYRDPEVSSQPYIMGDTTALPNPNSGIEPAGGYDVDGRTLILFFDSHNSLSESEFIAGSNLPTASNVTITFAATVPGGTLTLQEVVDQINALFPGVAEKHEFDPVGSPGEYVLKITSTKYGAGSSVCVRSNGTANAGTDRLGFSVSSDTIAVGSGFYADDDSDEDMTSPRLKIYPGAQQTLLSGYAGATPQTTVTAPFLDSNVQAGDSVVADGVLIGDIVQVESDILTMEVEQNLISHDAKFAPRRVWIRANNLSYPAPDASEEAEVKGTVQCQAETSGYVVSQVAPETGGPGLVTPVGPAESLDVNIVKNGTALSTYTVSSGVGWTTLAEIVAGINASPDVPFEAYYANEFGEEVTTDYYTANPTTTFLGLRTLADNRGSDASITVVSSTVATEIGFTTLPVGDAGENVRFAPGTPGVFTSLAPVASWAGTENFQYEVSRSGSGLGVENITMAAAGTLALAVAEFNKHARHLEAYASDASGVASATGTYLSVRTRGENVGTTAVITIKAGGDSGGIFVAGGPVADTTNVAEPNGSGSLDTDIDSQNLKWSIDNNLKQYDVLFVADEDDGGTSLQQVLDKVNAETPNIAEASSESPPFLVMKSNKVGESSQMVIHNGTANAGLGLTDNSANPETGNGRPAPDLAVDISGNVVLQSQLLFDGLTGIPYNPGFAPIIIAYKGLRLDMSPDADSPALAVFDDVDMLEAAADPISTDNPGALMTFLSLINAPSVSCAAIGVPEISADAPDGTPLGYAKCAEFLENEEVYALATASQLTTVHQTFLTHVNAMSEPEQKGERIYFFNPRIPDRANPTLIGSGTDANSTATANELVVDVNIAPALIAQGIDPNSPINPAGSINYELYIDLAGDDKYYLIEEVTAGTQLKLRTTFATGENADSFFSSDTLPTGIISDDWTVYIRGEQLLVAGTTQPDRARIAETIQEVGLAYGFRRGFMVHPDQCAINVTGLEQVVEGYYSTACIVGMVGQQPPQQGFTNFPITGLTRVVGSNDLFTNRQLNVMAAGGTYILVQDAQGAPVICRHQLSTDMSSIESRELSITKVVDYTAKFLRAGLRNFIGRSNITQPFLDNLSTVVSGQLNFLASGGVLIGADINNILQDADNPDTVLIDVTLDVPFPCNYIRLTLVI